jgi:hypothetical protein
MSTEEEYFLMCPNCDSQWCIDEIDHQRCYCCGYPNHREEDWHEEDEIDFMEININLKPR